MPILKSFIAKELENVQPGELITLDLGGRALGIAMNKKSEGYQIQVLLLASPLEARHPCWITLATNDSAISFGSDWMLEFDYDQVWPGNYEGIDQPGTILVAGDQALIRAGGDGQHVRPAHFDLNRFTMVSRTPSVGETVCIRDWRIWLTEADRHRNGARPFFEFEAPTKT